MVILIFIITFTVSLASVATGLLLSNNLRRKYLEQPIFSTLLYQQIFAFIFAMYGIWVSILVKLLFSTELIPALLMEKITSVQSLIAIPFQLLSWWFLIQLVTEFLHFKNIRFISLLLLFGILAFVFPVYLLFFKHAESIHRTIFPLYCITNGLTYSLIYILLLSYKSRFMNRKRKFWSAGAILLIGFILSAGTLFYAQNLLITILVILAFFILNLWPVILFEFMVNIQPEEPKVEIHNFETLCSLYEISKREAEIIQLICQGLTNKIIADKLFITLQTVKDHTSRIYLKTEVKNRTQLANLFRAQ